MYEAIIYKNGGYSNDSEGTKSLGIKGSKMVERKTFYTLTTHKCFEGCYEW